MSLSLLEREFDKAKERKEQEQEQRSWGGGGGSHDTGMPGQAGQAVRPVDGRIDPGRSSLEIPSRIALHTKYV